jgi:hypothetical protein
VSLGDVVKFIDTVKKSRVGLGELPRTYKALSYKSELEGVGLTLEGLKEVYVASKNYGDCDEVLKDINTYGSLKAIEEEIEKLAVKKSKLEVMVKELSNQVQERRALIEGLGTKAKEWFESSVEEVRKTIDL